MTAFSVLLTKIAPLYFMILLGFISTWILDVDKKSIARLLIYIINPAIVFYGTFKAEINFANLSLPILFFCVACAISLIFWWIGKLVWKSDTTKNILAFSVGNANEGYFGLPLVIILFDEKIFSIVVLSVLGIVLYINTLGFFIMARGRNTLAGSLMRIAKLPTIYTFSLGILLNQLNMNTGETIVRTMEIFKGAYSLLGMMIVGMGLSTVRLRSFDVRLISLSFVAKFLVWPLIIAAIIILDKHSFHFYDADVHRLMILYAVVPLGGSTVSLAAEFDIYPEKASVAVFLSTIFALFYIPFILGLFVF